MKKKIGTLLFLSALVFACSSDDSSPDPQPNPDDGIGFEITTAIADPVFEQALIDLNLDDKIDGTVLTSRIEDIVELVIDNKGITDITGIGDFKNLENLVVEGNSLARLDLTNNSNLKFLYAMDNELTFINVLNLDNLEQLEAQNNNLSSMDVSTNPVLFVLRLANNDIASLDVSGNPQINRLSIEDNPLTCIQVSQAQLDNIPLEWTKDIDDTYALDCE